jgi:hypothetical protein
MTRPAGLFWARIAAFFQREVCIWGVGVFVGIVYQIHFYANKTSYRRLGLSDFLDREALSELQLVWSLVTWLIIWRFIVVFSRLGLLRLSLTGSRLFGVARAIGTIDDNAFNTTESAPAVRVVVYGLRQRAAVGDDRR